MNTEQQTVKWKQLIDGITMPTPNLEGDFGMDLRAAEALVLMPNTHALISTGYSVEIPEGFGGLLCPRSGLAKKFRIGVVNSPGIIESTYRGPLGVLLENRGEQPFTIEVNDRIAQLVIVPHIPMVSQLVTELSDSVRGAQGFGASGVK